MPAKTGQQRPDSIGRASLETPTVGQKAPGTRRRSQWEKLLEGEAEDLGRKAVELAKSGDTVALRLCLERIAPVRKGRRITLSLPSMSTSADVTTALAAIIAQIAEGEITPDEAAVAASVIETKRKALETEELDRRVAAIEQQLSKGK